MIKALLTLLAVLCIALLIVASRLSTVTGERDTAQDAAEKAQASVASLRGTLRLQRELASDQAAIESTYIEEKQRAQDDAEYLRRCLADGSCGLRVAATCPFMRVDRAGAAVAVADAGAPELTAAARRAYPALVAGLRIQRAQIVGLQETITTLHARCRIGAAQ